MKELLEFIVKKLVADPEKVLITEIVEDNQVFLHVKVANEDYGKVIGKNGKVAQSLRSIVRASNTDNSKKYYIKIGEENN